LALWLAATLACSVDAALLDEATGAARFRFAAKAVRGGHPRAFAAKLNWIGANPTIAAIALSFISGSA
jgi:hypothetical protein